MREQTPNTGIQLYMYLYSDPPSMPRPEPRHCTTCTVGIPTPVCSDSESKVYLRRSNVAFSSRDWRRHGGGRSGGRSPDTRVDGSGPEGRRHRRHPRECVREAPEGVHFMQHAHKPCTCKPCTRMHTKERVSPENTSASRTIVQKEKERERAPKRAAPTHLRTPSQIPPESLPWHCRGTAVALPWHCRARCARARCARRARRLQNDAPKRDSNPGPRAGRPGRSPLGSPAGPSISSSSSIQVLTRPQRKAWVRIRTPTVLKKPKMETRTHKFSWRTAKMHACTKRA